MATPGSVKLDEHMLGWIFNHFIEVSLSQDNYVGRSCHWLEKKKLSRWKCKFNIRTNFDLTPVCAVRYLMISSAVRPPSYFTGFDTSAPFLKRNSVGKPVTPNLLPKSLWAWSQSANLEPFENSTNHRRRPSQLPVDRKQKRRQPSRTRVLDSCSVRTKGHKTTKDMYVPRHHSVRHDWRLTYLYKHVFGTINKDIKLIGSHLEHGRRCPKNENGKETEDNQLHSWRQHKQPSRRICI